MKHVADYIGYSLHIPYFVSIFENIPYMCQQKTRLINYEIELKHCKTICVTLFSVSIKNRLYCVCIDIINSTGNNRLVFVCM